jgi:hypothetical protein
MKFECGMNFGFAAPRGWYGSREGLDQIGQMQALNVNAVAAHVTCVQETYYSTRIFQDFEHTPGDAEVRAWITAARAAGLQVMLKPIIEPMDGIWRGWVAPPGDGGVFGGAKPGYREKWLASVKQMLLHYAGLAQAAKTDSFCLGSEYHRADGWNREWRDILQAVRAVYRGPVTYEFVPQSLRERKLAPDAGDWWRELDFLGYSVYPSTTRQEPTVDDFVKAMEPEREVVAQLGAEYGLPVVLAEIGCRSTVAGGADAAGYRAQGRYDGTVQRRYLDAVCRVFGAEPACRGIYWWKWDEHQPQHRPNYYTDTAGDQGFTLTGKPAAETLRACYARLAGT